MNTVECRDCGISYDENQQVCPNCGSIHKVISLSCNPISIKMAIELTGMQGRNPHLTGKKKILWEWTNIETVRGDNGAPVRRFKLVDRENNRYEEVVTDLSTGKIIHECREPLSEHQGHGSAKNK